MKLAFCLAILVLLLASGCGDDSATNPNHSFVTFSGVVTLYPCPGWGPVYRYTEHTGKPATITLRRYYDSLTYTAVTDRHSNFRLAVDTGTYEVTLSTFHMYPNPYGSLHLIRDTGGVELKSWLSYSPPDSIQAFFWYPSLSDTTLSEVHEQQTLEFLSDHMAGILNLRPAHRSLFVSSDVWVVYDQIAIREDVPAWKAAEQAQQVIQAFPNNFPEQFGFLPYFKVCLDLTSQRPKNLATIPEPTGPMF